VTRTPTRPTRARRARVLCVGLARATEALSEHLNRPAVHVDDLFAAMGELTNAPAAQPIETVFVASALLLNTSPRAVESLRDIDPAIRIVLVRDSLAPPELDTFAGELFDDTITLPHPDGVAPGRASAAPEDQTDHSDAPPQPGPGQLPAGEIETPATAGEVDAAHAAPVRQPQTHPSLRDVEHEPTDDVVTAERDPSETETLGDIDLVNAILQRSEQLPRLAVRLIAQQTGWTDIALHRKPTIVDDASAATVTHGDATLGMLTSANATARELKPWADWIGYWLALDASQRRHRLLAYRDDLTGAWNRRYFNDFLDDALHRARDARLPVTVMVFDIDDFKQYNDKYGHEAGDEILIEAVRLMQSVIRKSDRVCRIGGDEFAVIFVDFEGPRAAGSSHPETVSAIARRFQEQVCTMRFAKLGKEAPGLLTISGGLATFPWDGSSPEQMLHLADQRALQSKRAGKNVLTFGPEQDCP